MKANKRLWLILIFMAYKVIASAQSSFSQPLTFGVKTGISGSFFTADQDVNGDNLNTGMLALTFGIGLKF